MSDVPVSEKPEITPEVVGRLRSRAVLAERRKKGAYVDVSASLLLALLDRIVESEVSP